MGVTNNQPASLKIYEGNDKNTTYFTTEDKCLFDMIGDNPTIECDYYRVIDDGHYQPFVTHHVGLNMLFNLRDYQNTNTNYGRLYDRLLKIHQNKEA
tara:strand:- start:249 stop:539 length:291 start_codon:yes stop_codon:yes gene_type:complete